MCHFSSRCLHAVQKDTPTTKARKPFQIHTTPTTVLCLRFLMITYWQIIIFGSLAKKMLMYAVYIVSKNVNSYFYTYICILKSKKEIIIILLIFIKLFLKLCKKWKMHFFLYSLTLFFPLISSRLAAALLCLLDHHHGGDFYLNSSVTYLLF